ncbi:MAG: hypothetical protein KC442_01595, partial [Thermomicrobiales bacterium]|nr:hypothetical protein [Thermomicrobiales bacterium]
VSPPCESGESWVVWRGNVREPPGFLASRLVRALAAAGEVHAASGHGGSAASLSPRGVSRYDAQAT